MKLEEKGTAIKTLSNSFSILIKVNDSGDGVCYQYSDEDQIHDAEIEYIEDAENITVYADEEDGLYQAAFQTEEGTIHFLAEFLKIDR